jgi:large subunit ribosomal protein L4
MQIQTKDSGKAVDLNDAVFARPYSEALVHQVVTAFLAGARQGTKKQKTRTEVAGTTKKFKKQKGGGARHGDYKAPIFVGGGRAFAARPRSFEQKVNRKMYRAAIQTILSELLRQQRLTVIESLTLDTPKTKAFVEKMKTLANGRTLLVSEDIGPNLYLSARNVPNVGIVDVAAMDPATLVAADHVVMTTDAVARVQEWLA